MGEHPSEQKFEIRGADGATYPADLATARQWVAQGRITRTSQVYDVATGQWRAAVDIEALFPRVPPIAPETAARRKRGCQLAILLGLLAVLVGSTVGGVEPACGLVSIGLAIASFVLFVVWLVQRNT